MTICINGLFKSERGQNQNSLPQPCLIGAQKWAEMLNHPYIVKVPQQRGQIKAGPKEGGNATSPLHSRGSPTKGTKLKWAQKRAEMLHHPCIIGGPQRQARGENQKWLPHPCLLGGPQQRGQNQSGPKRGRRCYITPAFSGVANAKRGEKIRSGYLTPTFSGVPNKGESKWAQKRAEMLHHPCILGGPQQRGKNQSGSKRGRKCYITPAFSGVPKQMGTTSELVA